MAFIESHATYFLKSLSSGITFDVYETTGKSGFAWKMATNWLDNRSDNVVLYHLVFFSKILYVFFVSEPV